LVYTVDSSIQKEILEYLSDPYVQAITLLVGSFIIAKIIDYFITNLLRSFVRDTTTSIDDRLIDYLHRPIYYSILFFGWALSFQLADLPLTIQNPIISILKTILIVMWSSSSIKVFIDLISWYSSRDSSTKIIQKRTLPLFNNLSQIFIFIAASYFILLSWDIDVTAWLASAGVLGIVLGFAARDTVANLFAGIFIMADSPYKKGDYINLDTGERGYISEIGIRSTRIMTRDDIEITIPNNVIANSKIVNESGGPHEDERVRITVSVAYGSDLDLVKRLLVGMANTTEGVCKTPSPRARFREFGESGIVFQLLFWIKRPESRGRMVDEVSMKIYKSFNENKITIPFPQREVHVVNKDK